MNPIERLKQLAGDRPLWITEITPEADNMNVKEQQYSGYLEAALAD